MFVLRATPGILQGWWDAPAITLDTSVVIRLQWHLLCFYLAVFLGSWKGWLCKGATVPYGWGLQPWQHCDFWTLNPGSWSPQVVTSPRSESPALLNCPNRAAAPEAFAPTQSGLLRFLLHLQSRVRFQPLLWVSSGSLSHRWLLFRKAVVFFLPYFIPKTKSKRRFSFSFKGFSFLHPVGWRTAWELTSGWS